MGVYEITLCQELNYIDRNEVKIINKIGAYFYFDNPLALDVQDLTFDGIDALGAWEGQCLAKKEQTCKHDASSG